MSGTRADYGKIKSLMHKVADAKEFELHIFVTGMHTLSRYGSTWKEVEKDGFKNIYRYINQKQDSNMDTALSNTITGLSNYIHELQPDLIVVHGDRLEALAGALVGAFNNIKVAHIEGGEVSGTLDESIRHAVSKFSHFHFVANDEAKKRVLQLGEPDDNIFVIGSPDIDIMHSSELPLLEEVKEHYQIPFDSYSILMYHPVTTETDRLAQNVKHVVDAVLESDRNFVVIYPNNDEGSSIILDAYTRFEKKENIRIFPSIKFESFLTLLRHCACILGNSSAGVREAGVYKCTAIDLGNRQQGRYTPGKHKNLMHSTESKIDILEALDAASRLLNTEDDTMHFGTGDSSTRFMKVISKPSFWSITIQKQFIDVDF